MKMKITSMLLKICHSFSKLLENNTKQILVRLFFLSFIAIRWQFTLLYNFYLLYLQTNQHELDTFNEISKTITQKANQTESEKIYSENIELNQKWTSEVNLLENLHENLIQLRQQWIQLEDILNELETKSGSLLEKEDNLDLIVRSKEDIHNKFASVQVSTF